MGMDPLSDWQDAIKAIKPDKTNLTSKLADAIDQRVTGKLQLAMVQGPPAQFTWAKAIFVQLIEPLPPNPALPAGLMALTNAWMAATQASTLVISPGAFIGVSAPPTLFSVVAASLLLPPSIMAGAQAMQGILNTAVPISDPSLSPLALALFTAFSTLQGSVTGLNSVSPPAGPDPLAIVSPVL